MEWARDQFGNDVHASDRSLYNYSLSCPACRERVHLRSGAQRRPHFAHYGHNGKPECELYHPLNIVTKPSPVSPREEEHPKSGSTLHRGGIFLDTSSGRYLLHLKFPQLPVGMDIVGEIKIQTPFGEESYTAHRLQRLCFHKVSAPRIPLVEFVPNGELACIEEGINALVADFRASNNFFRVGEVWNRLLRPMAPLEWGERYQLLTKQTLNPTPMGLPLEVDCKDERQGWYLYNIVLPKVTQIKGVEDKEAIARHLEREVREPFPKAYFVDPPPHHIEQDGTYVFPKGTEHILLKRIGNCSTSIAYDLDNDTQARSTDINEEWTEITGNIPGNFSIRLNGHVALLGRVEECPLFQPEGVRVVIGDSTYEIFQAGLPEVIRQGTGESLSIDCPSPRVADNLELSQEMWIRKGTSFSLCGDCKNVDARNFGVLTWPVPEAPGAVVEAVAPQILARRAWLEGLVARYQGPDAVKRLRKQWDKVLPMNIDIELERLRPYIVSEQLS